MALNPNTTNQATKDSQDYQCFDSTFVYTVWSRGRSFILQNDKITKQAEASYIVINSVVEAGSYLGLVQFQSSATVLAELTEVTSVYVRENLTSLVPTAASGGTEIFNGLSKAIEVCKVSLI